MSDLRDWLGPIADELIPANGTMPSATEAGVTGGLLTAALAARPDLEPRLQRAQARTRGIPPGDAAAVLADRDPDAYEALTETVAGAYYSSPEVRALLGYTGQQFEDLPVPTEPEYVTEGLLAHVIARGPIHRGIEP